MKNFWNKAVLIASLPLCIIIPSLTVYKGIPETNEVIQKNLEKWDSLWDENSKGTK